MIPRSRPEILRYAQHDWQGQCHAERSEESGEAGEEILPFRFTQGFGSSAQHDRPSLHMSGLNQDSGCEILRYDQMLLVERGTLKVIIVDVAHNTSSSIQERYQSKLL